MAAFPDAFRARRTSAGSAGSTSTSTKAPDEVVRDVVEGAWLPDRAEEGRRGVRRRPRAMTVAERPAAGAAAHERHPRRPADRRGVRPGPRRGPRGAASRTSSRATRTPTAASPRRVAAHRRRRGHPRGRPAVLGSARRRRHAPARVAAWRSRAGATFAGSLELVARIAAARARRRRSCRWATRTS